MHFHVNLLLNYVSLCVCVCVSEYEREGVHACNILKIISHKFVIPQNRKQNQLIRKQATQFANSCKFLFRKQLFASQQNVLKSQCCVCMTMLFMSIHIFIPQMRTNIHTAFVRSFVEILSLATKLLLFFGRPSSFSLNIFHRKYFTYEEEMKLTKTWAKKEIQHHTYTD